MRFEKSQTKIIEHVNDFFSPINYDEILNVLKYKHDINSNNMNLSVVVPTKNRPTELRTFLQSLWSQNLLPDQLIIIDQGFEN